VFLRPLKSAVVILAVGAIASGLHVLGGSFDSIARCNGQTAGDGEKDEKLTDHVTLP
jgi:hypothetical protein